MIEPGAKYRHYKGHVYKVIALGKHSESLEDMVIYRLADGTGNVWCRPAAMWEELVNGHRRFEKIED